SSRRRHTRSKRDWSSDVCSSDLSSSNYLYSFKAYGAGQGINEHSYFIKIDFDLLNVKLTNPTCFTAMLSGTSVTGSTVKMGEYRSEVRRVGKVCRAHSWQERRVW